MNALLPFPPPRATSTQDEPGKLPGDASPRLLSRYRGLSRDPKLILHLKSLVHTATNKSVFLDCLQKTGTRTSAGAPWSPQNVNSSLELLTREGLLNSAFACPDELLHVAARDAVAAEYGAALAATVKRVFPATRTGVYGYSGRGAPWNVESLRRLIRLAVYANDIELFGDMQRIYDPAAVAGGVTEPMHALFAGTTLAMEWVATRAPVIQAELFGAKVAGLLLTGIAGTDLSSFIAHYRTLQDQPGFEGVRAKLLTLDLLGGRFDQVRAAIEGFGDPAVDPPDGPLGLRRVSLEGAVAFLEGRNSDAMQRYREALRRHRKIEGRRKLFLTGVHGLFFAMAMLRVNSAAMHGEIQSSLEIAMEEHSPYAAGFFALMALLFLAQGREGLAREAVGRLRATVQGAEPLSQACIMLAEYMIDPEKGRQQRAAHAERFELLRDTLPVLARVHAEILAAVADKPAPYKAWLREHPLPLEFTALIPSSQPWERALESLDALLNGKPVRAEAATTAPRKARRLAWFVDPATQAIEVAEQSAKGRDGWTDGRAIAMKRLHDGDPKLDYLTDQDRAALRTIRKEAGGWYGEESYAFDPRRTIPALVGHPAVFDARARSRPLELASYPLELVITERKGGYHIALSHSAEKPAVFLEPETPTRYRVVEFTSAMLPVQEILGAGGLTVPQAGRDRLVAMIQRNNPTLPIRAEIAEVGQEALEGRPTPVVQLVPFEQGLKISLAVRPFGTEGPAYVAGLGGRSVLGNVAGQQMRALRDLPREVAERAALIAACPTLADRFGGDAHEAIIEDLETSLEMLAELEAYADPPDRISVEWPEGSRMQVSNVGPDKIKLRVGQDRDWFSIDGTITLDEDQVLEMRFLLDRLDRTQGRFVSLGDGRFVALTRQLQSRLQRLAAVSLPPAGGSKKGGRQVHALGAAALEAVLEEAGDVKTDAAWKRHVARIRAAEGWTPKLPATLQAELRDYQVEGFVWLSRLARWGAGACLADDMGLGKTVQTIAVLLDQSEEGPSLVVAPTSVCGNWQTEIARFAPTLTAHRFAAATDRAALVASLGPRDVLVCSYGLLHQEAELLAGRPWRVAVLDEAQAIKNAQSKRAQASLSLQAGFRIALTGTPVENYLDELWSLFSFVNPGLLGAREMFQKRFAIPIERDGDMPARQALRALIRPFLLRRTKATVLSELPPRTEQTMVIEMSPPERAFYEALRLRALDSLAALDAPKGKRKIHILAEITRLRRACCNPALIDAEAGVPSGKLEAFLELVDDLIRNRHRALVFSQFTGHLHLVRAALDAKGISYAYLDGSTPAAEREKLVAGFQAGGADLFLISLRAGGTGLNLTAADYVVHLDPWWNPAVEDQASDRAHRMGQERPVTIYRLVMQDSIEERILRLHRDKRDLASELLEGSEAAGRLSEDEMLDLLRG